MAETTKDRGERCWNELRIQVFAEAKNDEEHSGRLRTSSESEAEALARRVTVVNNDTNAGEMPRAMHRVTKTGPLLELQEEKRQLISALESDGEEKDGGGDGEGRRLEEKGDTQDSKTSHVNEREKQLWETKVAPGLLGTRWVHPVTMIRCPNSTECAAIAMAEVEERTGSDVRVWHRIPGLRR